MGDSTSIEPGPAGGTRVHARVEDRIRCGKSTGLGHLPSKSMQVNHAWCAAAAIAIDLLAWLRLLCLAAPSPTPSPIPCATSSCTPPPAWCAASANANSRSPKPALGPRTGRMFHLRPGAGPLRLTSAITPI
ncbi:hypothetical protein EJK15_65480 [Nonomuraea basaltis]|nr:hypothetical protein EJK15_65480 [Nonomuraea basaltis]